MQSFTCTFRTGKLCGDFLSVMLETDRTKHFWQLESELNYSINLLSRFWNSTGKKVFFLRLMEKNQLKISQKKFLSISKNMPKKHRFTMLKRKSFLIYES